MEKKTAALEVADVPTFPYHQMASLFLQPKPHPGVVNVFILKKSETAPHEQRVSEAICKECLLINLGRELIKKTSIDTLLISAKAQFKAGLVS